MHAMAAYADVDECELVRFIIDGLDDRSAAVAMLYSARSVADLKNLVADYERFRARAVRNAPVVLPKAAILPKNTVLPNNNSTAVVNSSRTNSEATRCYNYRQFGHISTFCSKPKRPIDGCYNCLEIGHQHYNCPKKRKPVAAVINPTCETTPPLINLYSNDDLTDELAALQMVSVAFEFNHKVGPFIELFSLFDAGCPVNFIRQSSVPPTLRLNKIPISTADVKDWVV